MSIKKFVKLALVTSLVSNLFIVVVPQIAQSQTLFDQIFNQRYRQRQRRARVPQGSRQFWNQQRRNSRQRWNKDPWGQQRQRPAPVKIKKVAAPTFFNYRPAALKAVSFAALIKLNETTDNAIEHTGAIDQNTEINSTPAPVLENREFLNSLSFLREAEIKSRKDIGKAVTAFYAKHPNFIWVEDGTVSFKAELVVQMLSNADEVGLVAQDYFVELPLDNASDSELMRFEMNLSLMAVRYALDARNGKINPNKLSGYHDFPKSKFDAPKAIKQISSALSPSSYLQKSSPDNEQFGLLRDSLVELEKLSDDVIVIAPKTFIRPGQSHDELPNIVAAIRKKASTQLLQMHGETLTTYSRTSLYSEELVALVKDFQKEKKLKPDGIIGRNTISRMVDVNPQVKIKRVRLAMERLRWHPRDLGSRYVFINQPEYRARYIQNDNVKLSMRVIVGKKANQTNFFYDTIERVEFNPYWGVPQSIIINEMLPKLRANPSYLDDRGFEVTNSKGQQISSASVDWWNLGGKVVPYDVRQKPGARNALGELKILFPNKHAIYMHDTPSRGLFKKSRRALSHGCVRLQNPRGMAAAVLGTSVSTISSKIDIGENNKLELKHRIPVYIAYFTAWPNSEGEVKFFPDIYSRDKFLGKAIDKLTASREKAA